MSPACWKTRRGIYWVATLGGLCRFNPKAGQTLREPDGSGPRAATGKPGASPETTFLIYRLGDDPNAQRILTLLEDRVGTIWCGTWGGGLYRLDPVSGQWTARLVDLGPPEKASRLGTNALLYDRRTKMRVYV